MTEYDARFAENLRRLRRERGLTQRALAEALGYSEKTVSKWECASGLPDIDGLFAVTKYFNTTVESLFFDNRMRYYLGIDGGGTKTALLLTDGEGNVIRREYADACNPMDIGLERAKDILRRAIGDICHTVPMSSVTMFAGIAGAGSDAAKQEMHRFFASFGFGRFENDSDNRNILEAGLGERDGISVIVGTGICAFAKCEGKLNRIGGWGYFVDRGGSGFNLGRDALDAYFSAYDGTGEMTLLTELIEEKTNCLPETLVGRIYSGGKAYVASFAPLVTEAFLRGDAAADAILERNASCAARVILAAGKHFSEDQKPIPVVLCGGLSGDAAFVSRLTRMLAQDPRLHIEILSREPVWGAVMAAMKLV